MTPRHDPTPRARISRSGWRSRWWGLAIAGLGAFTVVTTFLPWETLHGQTSTGWQNYFGGFGRSCAYLGVACLLLGLGRAMSSPGTALRVGLSVLSGLAGLLIAATVGWTSVQRTGGSAGFDRLQEHLRFGATLALLCGCATAGTAVVAMVRGE